MFQGTRIGEGFVAQASRLLRIAEQPQHQRQNRLAGDLRVLGKAEGQGAVLRGIEQGQRLLQVDAGGRELAET